MKKTKILFNGKEVEKLEIHTQYNRMWMRATFKDGKTEDTYIFKGGL